MRTMPTLLDEPDKKLHFSGSLALMLVLGGLVLAGPGTGDAGLGGVFAVFAIVLGAGFAKEHLWDPWMRPALGLGPKGEPDMKDMKANIAGAGAGLIIIVVAGFGMALQGV